MPSQTIEVDPSGLRLPPSRRTGADPLKLHRQIATFGSGTAGMPEPWIYRGSDGELMLYNGVTRASRVAKLSPGMPIRVLVIGEMKVPVGHLPTVGETL